MMGCAYYKAISIGRHLPHTRDCGSSHTLSRHVLPFNAVHKPLFTVSIAVSVKLLNNINDIPKSEKGRSKRFRDIPKSKKGRSKISGDIPKSEKGRSKISKQIPANIQSDFKVEKRGVPKIGAFQTGRSKRDVPKRAFQKFGMSLDIRGHSKIEKGAFQNIQCILKRVCRSGRRFLSLFDQNLGCL